MPVAFVSGASRGIGRCAALALARRGFDLVLSARTTTEGSGRSAPSVPGADSLTIPGSLETTAADVRALGRQATTIPFDIMDQESIRRCATDALNAYGRVDAMLNCAFYQGPGNAVPFLDVTMDQLESAIIGDYLHQMLMLKSIVPHMSARGSGVICNMTSRVVTRELGDGRSSAPGTTYGVAYAAGKAAFHRVAGVLQYELGSAGLRFYNVDPGLTVTETRKARLRGTPAENEYLGDPPEVTGEVVAWLTSDDPDAVALAGKAVVARQWCVTKGLLPGWTPYAEGRID